MTDKDKKDQEKSEKDKVENTKIDDSKINKNLGFFSKRFNNIMPVYGKKI
ncbi:hypothetical protein HYE01_03940 [Mycoplasmopsis bovis]|nr:hypothetical protein HYE01_03940 [Mycoplasmopsis bovis]